MKISTMEYFIISLFEKNNIGRFEHLERRILKNTNAWTDLG